MLNLGLPSITNHEPFQQMEGDRTAVIVTAGIFANADMANMTMVGYGPGKAMEGTQPIPRIQTKTTLSLMLGGKGMPMPDQEGEGQIPGE